MLSARSDGPYMTDIAMQPRPMRDTSGPVRPSLRLCIAVSRSMDMRGVDHRLSPRRRRNVTKCNKLSQKCIELSQAEMDTAAKALSRSVSPPMRSGGAHADGACGTHPANGWFTGEAYMGVFNSRGTRLCGGLCFLVLVFGFVVGCLFAVLALV